MCKLMVVLFASLLSLAPSVARSADLPPLTEEAPPGAPKDMGFQWRGMYRAAMSTVSRIQDQAAAELGPDYAVDKFTPKDIVCMGWFAMWNNLKHAKRKVPNLCPQEYVDYLEDKKDKACTPDDTDGPNAPARRGWDALRWAVMGPESGLKPHRDSLADVPSQEAMRLSNALRAFGAAGLLVGEAVRLVPASAAPAVIVPPRPLTGPLAPKVQPNDVL